MSSPASALGQLSLTDKMPTHSTKGVESLSQAQGASRKIYDLSSLEHVRAGIVRDGLQTEQMRLIPVLTKALYPEAGFVGFEVTEVHSVRLSVAEDHNQGAGTVGCNCATFRRMDLCPHVVWLYDGLQASLDITPASPPSSSLEEFSEPQMRRKLAGMATRISQQARGLTERINSMQPHQMPAEEVDQQILDVFAVFDGTGEDSPRKRRRADDSTDDSKPSGSRLRTCLEISSNEFFADVQPPNNSIKDIVVSGNLLATLKGLVRYGTLFRESLFNVIDARFRAEDFLMRLDNRLSEWQEKWENFRKDRRTTVPASFIIDYAKTVREVVRQIRAYEEDRKCPDSFYDHAIDLGITILEEVYKSNADLFEGHSRQESQARHTIPAHPRDRNLFINLVSDPPDEQMSFVRRISEMVLHFDPHKPDGSQVTRLKQLCADLGETETVQLHHISPLLHLVQQCSTETTTGDATRSRRSTPVVSSPASQASMLGAASGQSQSRRYRELRAAPTSQ